MAKPTISQLQKQVADLTHEKEGLEKQLERLGAANQIQISSYQTSLQRRNEEVSILTEQLREEREIRRKESDRVDALIDALRGEIFRVKIPLPPDIS